jgi:hypothetical protein
VEKIIIAICILINSSGCINADFSSAPSVPPILTTQKTPTPMESPISNIIGDILSHPDQYSEKSVEIYGYFRGWDVLHEIQQAPPVSRSDWVIADSSGAIYVTGLAPGSLVSSSSEEIWNVIHLSATVRYDEKRGIVYLEAETVEIVDR